MIEVLIKEGKPSKKKQPLALCDASIPLTFIKISPAAVRRLAVSCNVTTVEELHKVADAVIYDCIKDRQIRRDIFALKEQIRKKVTSARYRNILLFHERACAKNIRVKSSQRAQLMGVMLFSTLLRKTEEVIKYVLDVADPATPFRQKAVLIQLQQISNRSIVRA